MSTELFNYIESVKPSFGNAKKAKVGVLLMYYITLAGVPGGRVRMENVLTTSSDSFLCKVLRNMPLVRSLAFALRIDILCVYDDSPVPDGLKRLCARYYINIQSCIDRNQDMKSVREELWDFVIFARVALAVMVALYEDAQRHGRVLAWASTNWL